MSSGTKVGDYQTTVSTPFGPGKVGCYWSRTHSGEDDPLHKHAINNYSMSYNEVWDGLLKARVLPNGTFAESTWVNRFGGYYHDPVSFDSNDDNSLVNKLGDKIRRHEFNAATSLGAEGKDALKQIAGAALSVTRGMRDLKRGNVQGALKQFGLSPKHAKEVGLHKDLSNKVLATQLGWLPLLGDIDNAYGAVRALTEKPMSMTHHKGQRKTVVIHPNGYGDFVCGEKTISRRVTWTLSENFTVWQSLSLSNPYDLAHALWAGAPLSFIADWFLPVSSYLSARSVVHGLRGSGYMSTLTRYTVRGVDLSPHVEIQGFNAYHRRGVSCTRQRLSSLSGLTALPTFKDFNQIPSWKRALTATTLATQMFL